MMLHDRSERLADELKAAGRRAIAEAHAAGVPAYYIDPSDPQRRIVEEWPDGTRVLLCDAEEGSRNAS